MTEDVCAFYCGGIVAICVAVQVATLMFEGVAKSVFWGAGIFGLTNLVITGAHDWLGVSWRVLYGVSILYFLVTMGVGDFYARRRKRRFERKYKDLCSK